MEVSERLRMAALSQINRIGCQLVADHSRATVQGQS